MIKELSKNIDNVVGLEKNVLWKSIAFTVLSMLISNLYLLVISLFSTDAYVGELAFYRSSAIFLVTISIIGLDTVFIKELGKNELFNRWDLVKLIKVSVILVIVAFFNSSLFTSFFNVSNEFIVFVCAYTFYTMISFIIQMKSNTALSIVLRNLHFPLLILLISITIFSLNGQHSVSELIYYYSLAVIFSSFLLCWYLYKKSEKTNPIINFNIRLSDGFKFLPFSLSFIVISSSDTVIAGYFLTYEEVGIYAIATSLSGLALVGLLSINTFSPKLITKLHKQRNIQQLNSTLRKLSYLVLIPIGPVFLCSIYFYASTYSNSDNLTTILTVYLISFFAVFVNSLTGPCGFVLNMTGKQAESTRIVLVAAIMNIILNVLLVNVFGVYGIAISTLICVSYMNLAMSFTCSRLLGIKSGLL